VENNVKIELNKFVTVINKLKINLVTVITVRVAVEIFCHILFGS